MTPIYVNTDHLREFADDRKFNFLNIWNYDGSVFTSEIGKTSGINLLAFFTGKAQDPLKFYSCRNEDFHMSQFIESGEITVNK